MFSCPRPSLSCRVSQTSISCFFLRFIFHSFSFLILFLVFPMILSLIVFSLKSEAIWSTLIVEELAVRSLRSINDWNLTLKCLFHSVPICPSFGPNVISLIVGSWSVTRGQSDQIWIQSGSDWTNPGFFQIRFSTFCLWNKQQNLGFLFYILPKIDNLYFYKIKVK